MIISSIVAVAEDNVIGLDGKIPWRMPKDMKWFRNNTVNHHVLMGRKNYESLNKPLSKRTNLVVTRKKDFKADGCKVFNHILEAINYAAKNGEEELFIIGGQEIYQQTKHIWDRLYFTSIEASIKGNVFFPEINWDEWNEDFVENHPKDSSNPYNFTFKTLSRKQ